MSGESGSDPRTLDRHFAGGVAWTASAKWATQLLSWGSVFIVARLLSTADFGISEMASYFAVLTSVLAEFGVGTAVLQMRELERKTLLQLNTFACLVGAVAYVLSFFAAPLVASFFHNQNLTNLIRVNNLGFLIIGFQSVPLGLLQRDMDYRRLSFAEAFQALLLAVITIAAAWSGLGYWSLVIGAVLSKAAGTVLMCSWKPLSFAAPHWEEIRAPIQFGRQAAIGRLAWVCYTQSDGIVTGRVLGDSVLGVYRMAMNLASAPAEKISTLIMRAAGPLFAKVQSDLTQVRRYFLILVEVLTMVELPLMLGLGMVAPQAIQAVLGAKWAGAAGPLRWLVLFMTMRTLGTLMEQVLISQRATAFMMRMSLFNLVVMPAAFVVGAHWKGPSGVAASWIILAPLTLFPTVWKALRTIHLSVRELALALAPASIGAGAMVGVVFGLRLWLESKSLSLFLSLALQIAVGALVYSGILLGLFRARILRYYRFLRSLREEKAGEQAIVK